MKYQFLCAEVQYTLVPHPHFRLVLHNFVCSGDGTVSMRLLNIVWAKPNITVTEKGALLALLFKKNANSKHKADRAIAIISPSAITWYDKSNIYYNIFIISLIKWYKAKSSILTLKNTKEKLQKCYNCDVIFHSIPYNSVHVTYKNLKSYNPFQL